MATSGNVLLLYDNMIDRAGVTLSASSAGRPVTNLLDIRPRRAWRSTGVVSEYIQADAGPGNRFDADTVALIGHNATAAATVRFRMGDDVAFTTWRHDTGAIEMWPSIVGAGMGGAGDGGAGGYPILTPFQAFTALRIIRLGAVCSGRYARLDLADPGNAAGYLQLGRWMAGLGVQPAFNFARDWDWTQVDPAEQQETDGGGLMIQPRGPKYRTLTLRLAHLSEIEATGSFADLRRIVGRSRSLLVVLFPAADDPLCYRTTIYGVMPDNERIAHSAFDNYTTSITIRELV